MLSPHRLDERQFKHHARSRQLGSVHRTSQRQAFSLKSNASYGLDGLSGQCPCLLCPLSPLSPRCPLCPYKGVISFNWLAQVGLLFLKQTHCHNKTFLLAKLGGRVSSEKALQACTALLHAPVAPKTETPPPCHPAIIALSQGIRKILSGITCDDFSPPIYENLTANLLMRLEARASFEPHPNEVEVHVKLLFQSVFHVLESFLELTLAMKGEDGETLNHDLEKMLKACKLKYKPSKEFAELVKTAPFYRNLRYVSTQSNEMVNMIHNCLERMRGKEVNFRDAADAVQKKSATAKFRKLEKMIVGNMQLLETFVSEVVAEINTRAANPDKGDGKAVS